MITFFQSPNTPSTARRGLLKASLLSVITLLAACGSDDDESNNFQEIMDQGAGKYLGVYTPVSASDVDAGGVVTHEFGDAADGPKCLDGSDYRMATRDSQIGSDKLMIFLEGGGACHSGLCAATLNASVGIPTPLALLDPALPVNPVMGWNTAYLPYCDGSLFSGDADNDYDGDGPNPTVYNRGLKNLSAALDVIQTNYPAPSKIILTGQSAGGFGTIFALPLVRALYPDVQIDVVNDSGVGVGSVAFFDTVIADWNSGAFMPPSICPECYESGDLTEYFNWQFQQDDNFRMAMLSSKQDSTIADFFLGIGGPAFEAKLLPMMANLEASNPERFRSFITNGNAHTFLQAGFASVADGVVMYQWLQNMRSGSTLWVSAQDPAIEAEVAQQ